jgi:hypothetical protein
VAVDFLRRALVLGLNTWYLLQRFKEERFEFSKI